MNICYFKSKIRLKLMNRKVTVLSESFDPENDESYDVPVFPKTENEKQRIITILKSSLVFNEMDDDELEKTVNAMSSISVRKDDTILRQGDEDNSFFVVKSGVFEEYTEHGGVKEIVAVHDGEGFFGVLSLMHQTSSDSTVKATTDGSLWTLDRITFRRIAIQGAHSRRQLYKALFARVPVLAALTDEERSRLVEGLVGMNFADGERIISEGEDADGMYFLVSGEVRVTKRLPEGEVEVKRLGQGDYFGEFALITKKPRLASVSASGPVHVAFLEVDTFERLLGPCLDIMRERFDDYERQINDLLASRSN